MRPLPSWDRMPFTALAAATPAPTSGRPQDHEIVNRARQADARDQPDEPRGEAELSRKHRADQRAGASDGREVMAEQHEPVRRVVVVAVVPDVGRCRPAVVERHDAGGYERAVVAVSDCQDTKNGKDYVKRAHGAEASLANQSRRSVHSLQPGTFAPYVLSNT